MENRLTENKMGVMPIGKLVFSMSLPAVISMTLQAVYNIVDSLFVAQISEDALAAVTLVFPLQLLLIAVGIGTGIGLNSLISRRLGEKRFDDANAATTHGFLLIGFNWIIFLLIGFFLSAPFFRWYSDDAQLVQMATSYCTINLCFSIFLFTQITCEKTLQGTGNMVLPMVSNMIGCIVNIILDPIMIFGLFGFSALGVSGAAIATVIGQAVGCITICSFFFLKEHPVKVTIRNFRFSWRTIKEIYIVALPGMVMQAIPSLVNIILNMLLISFSVTAVSVFGVYFRLQSFIFMPVFGVTQGAMPVMGYNYGAGNKHRLVSTTNLTLKATVVIMFIGFIIFQLFPNLLMSMFNASEDMLSMGIMAMRLLSLCFVPAAVGITFATFFQALGYGMYSLIVTMLRQIIVLLPAAWIFSRFVGVSGIWISFPFAEIFSLACSVILYIRIYHRELSYMPEGNA